MLKLIPEVEVAHARPPLGLALVIDTSASMQEFLDQDAAQRAALQSGQVGVVSHEDGRSMRGFSLDLPTKLTRAMEAGHQLVDDVRLLPTDQLAIIRFDDDASVLFELAPLSDKQAAHKAIGTLIQFQGGTQMAKGLRLAREELAKVPPQTAKRVILLTDGETFDEDECQKLALQLGTENTPVVAIGVGLEYNENLMRSIADATQGRPYHLQDIGELATILDSEVGSVVREVMTDVRASVAAVKGVGLDRIARVYPSVSEVALGAQPYQLGNIAAGDFTVFVLEFTISGVPRPPSRVRIAQIGLAGDAPGLGRQAELPPMDVFVTFTTDEAAIAEVDDEVLGYVQQLNVDRMMQEAAHLATTDLSRARQTLQLAASMTQRLGNAAATQILNNALDELNSTGTISADTRKTVALGGRTKTVKVGEIVEGVPSEDEIRRLTGI